MTRWLFDVPENDRHNYIDVLGPTSQSFARNFIESIMRGDVVLLVPQPSGARVDDLSIEHRPDGCYVIGRPLDPVAA